MVHFRCAWLQTWELLKSSDFQLDYFVKAIAAAAFAIPVAAFIVLQMPESFENLALQYTGHPWLALLFSLILSFSTFRYLIRFNLIFLLFFSVIYLQADWAEHLSKMSTINQHSHPNWTFELRRLSAAYKAASLFNVILQQGGLSEVIAPYLLIISCTALIFTSAGLILGHGSLTIVHFLGFATAVVIASLAILIEHEILSYLVQTTTGVVGRIGLASARSAIMRREAKALRPISLRIGQFFTIRKGTVLDIFFFNKQQIASIVLLYRTS
jgi:hypothetical protein